ncbi:MAG: GNAT family N-acetyltransferase [Clostridia bacterium]|nr:GNAT family N-acetyltransferase [Clostridia bacterium]
MKHCGTHPIETPRLFLRAFTDEDCGEMLQNWISNPKVQFAYGEQVYSNAEEVGALLNRWKVGYARLDFYRWAIVEKASGENIGQIAFCRVYEDCRTAEIEYCIGEPFWGNGYANEALSAVIDFVFQHSDFCRLEAYHRAENRKSGRVLEKSPMHLTDTVQRFLRENQPPHGEVCYCITKE